MQGDAGAGSVIEAQTGCVDEVVGAQVGARCSVGSRGPLAEVRVVVAGDEVAQRRVGMCGAALAQVDFECIQLPRIAGVAGGDEVDADPPDRALRGQPFTNRLSNAVVVEAAQHAVKDLLLGDLALVGGIAALPLRSRTGHHSGDQGSAGLADSTSRAA